MDFALIQTAVGVLVTLLLLTQLAPLLRAAPFVTTGSETVTKMVKLGDIHGGEKAADLGSGDGRIVIGLARAGAEAHGYEINPLLALWSRYQIRKAGLSDQATIHWKSFWRQDYTSFQVVTVFGMIHMMKPLEAKLRAELKPGSRVIANYFPLPTWPHSKRDGSVYVYEQA